MLTLIFSTPGLYYSVAQVHASLNLNDIIGGYLDGVSNPGNNGNWPWPWPNPNPTPQPQPQPQPLPQLPEGCSESTVTRIGASGDDGNRPQNVLDNNYNTRWSNYGKGSYIQIELEKDDILCAVDIAWHRGDVRINDFSISTSQDGSSFTTLFSGKSSGQTNSYERYLIQDSDLKAKYIRVTVFGNTENDWASISEIRAYSKPSSTSPTPDPDPDPDPDPNSGVDIFGVKKIYPDKPNGEKWFMNMNNPNSDSRFDPKLTLKKNADGSWKVTSDKVRMNVFTSTGYHQDDIDTYDQKQLSTKGYMQAVNDWRNVEITGIVKINSASDSDFDLTWYAHGGKHNSDVPCEGTAYKGGLFKDGRSRFAKEQWHSGGYSFTPAQKNIGSIEDKWVGYKAIMYNTVVNGKPAVKLENWVDENNDGNWKKIFGYTDSGGFGDEGDRCGGSPDQLLSWGGPIVTFRWDGSSNVDIKNLSVREIAVN